MRVVLEYLLRPDDGDFLVVPAADFVDAFHPRATACVGVEGWGDYRYQCGEAEIAVSFEDPGVLLTIESDLDAAAIMALVEATGEQVSLHTGRRLFIVPL